MTLSLPAHHTQASLKQRQRPGSSQCASCHGLLYRSNSICTMPLSCARHCRLQFSALPDSLHLIVQLECVKFLVEQREANVNQQDGRRGSTPLHRCARMAHHCHGPFLKTFQYLLLHGADPALMTFCGFDDLNQVDISITNVLHCRSSSACEPSCIAGHMHMQYKRCPVRVSGTVHPALRL